MTFIAVLLLMFNFLLILFIAFDEHIKEYLKGKK